MLPLDIHLHALCRLSSLGMEVDVRLRHIEECPGRIDRDLAVSVATERKDRAIRRRSAEAEAGFWERAHRGPSVRTHVVHFHTLRDNRAAGLK